MASIISVDTLQDSAGSNEITTANVKTAFDDRVKAWINFDATNNNIGDSLNASSLTDNATGQFYVNVSSSFGNTSYSVTSGQGNAINNYNTGYDSVVPVSVTQYLFSKYHIANGVFQDPNKAQMHCMGDLA